jgi:hypothetical protein
MDSTKIFIDTDSEITFVLEKILNSKTESVVLVVPDRASLMSSIVGLKLIKKIVDKSPKLLVLVTLDEIGSELAKNAGLYVVSRIGEINEEIWEKARKAKFEVIKKDARPRYVPKLPEVDLEKEGASISAVGLINDHSKVEDADEKMDLEKNDATTKENIDQEESKVIEKEIPQIRINIDPEDVKVPEMKFLDLEEMSEREIKKEEPMIEKEKTVQDEPAIPGRVRKNAASVSGISNLKFAVGKDISSQKKN